MFININKQRAGQAEVPAFFANKITLKEPGTNAPIDFCINSHVDSGPDAPRPFFTGTARLPQEPVSSFIAALRQSELAALRGTAEDAKTERKGSDRIYDYDVYNDLGNPKAVRPILGKAGGQLAYPRRLRTGRPVVDGKEVAAAGGNWLPPDEKFDGAKTANFESRTLLAALAAVPALAELFVKKQFGRADAEFKSIDDISRLYNGEAGDDPSQNAAVNFVAAVDVALKELLADINAIRDHKSPAEVAEAIIHLVTGVGKFNREVATELHEALHTLVDSLAGLDVSQRRTILHSLSRNGGVHEADFQDYAQGGQDAVMRQPGVVLNLFKLLQPVIRLLRFQTPAVVRDRDHVWTTDEEWGREQLAGQNACIIQALWRDAPLKQLPPKSAITEAALQGHLEGASVAQLLSGEAPRLFLIDYVPGFADHAERVKAAHPNNVLYAGRAVLYLRNDDNLVPVAIELQAPGQDFQVFTQSDPPTAWLLAKAIFSSIDSGYHQLISHWDRAHASCEPYLIATRRQLSVMHPVNKLLMNHFRFTLNINSSARTSLVNAGGTIEANFTPGSFSMELSAFVYDATWTFEGQALPHDLVNRGVARATSDGQVELLLADYPYADDGMLLWSAFEEWFASYLRLYYDDGVAGKRVTDDPELTAWWSEIRDKGHPDVKRGWPQMRTVADLTRILTTIAWTASAHHAAVNFGQYDFSGFMPNRSPMTRKALPAKGSAAYKALVAQDPEAAVLPFLASPQQAVMVMITLTLLSTHSGNEEYINDLEHPYITAHNKLAELWGVEEAKHEFLMPLLDHADVLRGALMHQATSSTRQQCLAAYNLACQLCEFWKGTLAGALLMNGTSELFGRVHTPFLRSLVCINAQRKRAAADINGAGQQLSTVDLSQTMLASLTGACIMALMCMSFATTGAGLGTPGAGRQCPMDCLGTMNLLLQNCTLTSRAACNMLAEQLAEVPVRVDHRKLWYMALKPWDLKDQLHWARVRVLVSVTKGRQYNNAFLKEIHSDIIQWCDKGRKAGNLAGILKAVTALQALCTAGGQPAYQDLARRDWAATAAAVTQFAASQHSNAGVAAEVRALDAAIKELDSKLHEQATVRSSRDAEAAAAALLAEEAAEAGRKVQQEAKAAAKRAKKQRAKQKGKAQPAASAEPAALASKAASSATATNVDGGGPSTSASAEATGIAGQSVQTPAMPWSGSRPEDTISCPITQEVMRDPVICADGHTSERSAIAAWLKVHHTLPMTNELLASKDLIPNAAVRQVVSLFLMQKSR
ncbi:hypothetical protein WJX72_007819 [[Myrmecia] bisecta]|uniref:U-box domain-containing protein n=1 Tax=[Myrmecia] bisecta TaxID=41462 RepID=A0AAW1R7K3_9CHLO